VRGHAPEAVEQALAAIFAGEGRARALRLEGTYSAVLRRVMEPELDASYRYLLLRPHADAPWTPVFELGNHTVGLEAELSRALNGAAVFTTFVYGDAVAGYRLARDGAEVDRYLSDPTYFLDGEDDPAGTTAEAVDPSREADLVEHEHGHPERFADLLPAGTAPDDFWRVVLAPGWWEEHAGTPPPADATDEADEAADDDALVDEQDRMRCIGLALELWGPEEYPLAQDPEELADALAGPAIVLAFA
jgi:hypothetical protein